MTPLDQHLLLLQSYFKDARLEQRPSGSGLVVCESVILPAGWNKAQITVRFVAPVGYPIAKPDCFWADTDLRLANGAMPKATGFNPIPETPGSYLWFSWHVAHWNPNRDTFVSYFRAIQDRLESIQ